MEPSKRNKILNYIFYFVVIISLLGVLITCDGKVKQHWQEEVLLHNGKSLWVERDAVFNQESTSFLTIEKGIIYNMMVTIKVPENPIAPPPPIWSFNAVPILLDYDTEKQSWIMIATLFHCSSWSMAGRPKLATWQYIVENNQWVVVPLDSKYVGRRTNLSTSFTDDRVKLTRITKEVISKWKTFDNSIYNVVNGTRAPNGCSY